PSGRPERATFALPGPNSFPLDPHARPQAVAEPAVEFGKNAFGVRKSVVAEPPVHVSGNPADALLHREAPVTARKLPQPLLEPLDRLGCQTNARAAASVVEAEPEEFALPRAPDRALCPVPLQLQSRLQEGTQTRHHPFCRPPGLDVHVAVVRVAAETMPSSLQLLVEVIEQDVGQKR